MNLDRVSTLAQTLLYEGYLLRVHEYTMLITDGKREPTKEEQEEAEHFADEWLKRQPIGGQARLGI